MCRRPIVIVLLLVSSSEVFAAADGLRGHPAAYQGSAGNLKVSEFFVLFLLQVPY